MFFLSFIILSINSLWALPSGKIELYELDYKIDFSEQRLYCDAMITTSRSSPADTLSLLLYRLLKVKGIWDENGNKVEFQQNITPFTDWQAMTVNQIILPTKGISKFHIKYEGTLLGYTETGMTYVHDNIDPQFTILRMDAYAYPIVATTSWAKNQAQGLTYFDYVVSVTIPDSLNAVNGGELVEKSSIEKGKIKYTYKNFKPAWRIDLAIAKYSTITSGGLAVHFFRKDSIGAGVLLMNSTKAKKSP